MALCNRYFIYFRYSRALCNRYCGTESEDCCGHCMGRQSALEQLVPLPSISHLSHLPLSPISSILLFRPYFPSYFVSHLFHLTLSPIFSILLFLPSFPSYFVSHLSHLLLSPIFPILLCLPSFPSYFVFHISHLVTDKFCHFHQMYPIFTKQPIPLSLPSFPANEFIQFDLSWNCQNVFS